jgi:hypothetical protein
VKATRDDKLLRALAHLRRNEWQKAHALVMDLQSKLAFHIHGLVHRIEGDMEPARYWYARAEVPLTRSMRLAAELKKIESEVKAARGKRA